jgi:hypothetical protein
MNIEGIASGREHVVASIQKAAKANQVDFDYLLAQAKVESGLNPQARAKTSSATGLFQFTSSTWLNVVRRHGDKVGLTTEAAELKSPNASSASIAKVLAMRQEPAISAELAARFALDNAKSLNSAGHMAIGPTELYLAHFLGAGGATTFLNGLRDAPNQAAAKALPQAANANTNIFYDGSNPRSYREIYDRFAQKFSTAATSLPVQAAAVEAIKPKELRLSLSDQKIADIAARTVSENRISANPAAPIRAAETPISAPSLNHEELGKISQEVLQTYLKGFNLIDHDNGRTLGDTRPIRDASRGANMHEDDFSADGNIGPLAQGSRLVLKAVQTSQED